MSDKISIDTISYYKLLNFSPVFGIRNNQNQLVRKYNVSDLPFFCKMEHIIESKSKIPFRFRLGDINYVNMLENKR